MFWKIVDQKMGLQRTEHLTQLFQKILNEGSPNAGYQVCVDEELVLFKGPDSHPLEEAVQTAVVDDVVPGDDDDDDGVVPVDDFN